jgi:hypothetical protein
MDERKKEGQEMQGCISEHRAGEIRALYTEGRLGLVSFKQVDELDFPELWDLENDLRMILSSDDVCLSAWRPDMWYDGRVPSDRVERRRLRMEIHFNECFHHKMGSILDDYFGGTDRSLVSKSTLCCLRQCFYGLEEIILRECNAEGGPVIFHSDDGKSEEVFEISLGVEQKEQDGTSGNVSREDEDDYRDERERIETFIGVCRYRGILSMNLVRDVRLFLS